jgi:ADP-ribosyl-[dinitrogen reductase] hydrolase
VPITHGAPEAVEACALLAEILVDAIASGDKALALAPRDNAVPGIAKIARGSWRRSRDEISSSGYVVDTLEAALWAVNEAQSLEQAVLLAANLGDDADTVAAVAGQIAGALWGFAGIPARWLSILAWREQIEGKALGLMLKGASV